MLTKMKSLKDKIIGKSEVNTEDKPKVKVEKETRKDNKKTMKKTIITAFFVLALPMLALAYFQPATLTNGANKVAVYSQEQANKYFSNGYVLDEKKIGATQAHTQLENFYQGITVGSRTYATSTVSNAGTLVAKDLINFDVIDFTMNGAALTLTMPASSTLSGFIPLAGMSMTKMIRNATTTAQNITIAGATGVTLKKQSGGALTITGDTDASNYALITFTRKKDKNIVASMLTFVD